MNIKILGQKLRVEILVIILIVGMFIGVNMWCSCAGGIKEGFNASVNTAGSAINYSIGKGVPQSWENVNGNVDSNSSNSWYKSLEGNVGGSVPLPEGQLAMFTDNKFDPNCCPSTYTTGSGCACISPEQAKYLNQRGGNRTLPTEY
jgi:hypothetical protein